MYSDNDIRLYHHGILGQKWGVQNGPPYPIGASDHSASEKRAGWRKSLGSGKIESKNKNADGSLTAAGRKRLAKQIDKGWKHTNFKKDGSRYSSSQKAAEKNKDLRRAALNAKNVQDLHDKWIKLHDEWFDRSWDDDFDTNSDIFKLKKDEDAAYEEFKAEAGKLGEKLLGQYADKSYTDMATKNYMAARGAIMNIIHDDSIRRRTEEDPDQHFLDSPDPYKTRRNQ